MPVSQPNSVAEVAKLIDHTILAPAATREQVIAVALEALNAGTASACVQPYWVRDVADVLKGSEVLACSVVGFPHGANRFELIAQEAERAVRDGASEIDMVQPIGLAKMGDWAAVEKAVRTVKAAIGDNVLKVIFEICELTDQEIVAASKASIAGGADFIKTSTGFAKSGATISAVALMASVAGETVGVKAAGGIRTLADLQAMVEAGATRIGASSTLKILDEAATVFA
ncbi:deoxyribose-phosphate aldolase [bacterium]|nr:deoxyribose-phosphate aldolase [bacterium]